MEWIFNRLMMVFVLEEESDTGKSRNLKFNFTSSVLFLPKQRSRVTMTNVSFCSLWRLLYGYLLFSSAKFHFFNIKIKI